MAYSTFSCAPDMTSDATFRAWASAISAALAAVGLTQTSDTGQINLTTVTKPGGASTMAGYQIWQFAALTGNPIYFKIEYGTGNSTARPGLRFTFGNGSNGSGTITGNTYTTDILGALNSETSYPCMVSSIDGHTLGMCLWIVTGSNTNSLQLAVGRTVDDTDNVTADGIDIAWSQAVGSANTMGHVYLPANGGGLPVERKGAANIFHCLAPSVGTNTFGTQLGQNPLYLAHGAHGNPPGHALVIFIGDYGNAAGGGQVIESTIFGTTKYFLHPGYPGSTGSTNGNANINGLAVRYT
jgi:hypothetical protein